MLPITDRAASYADEVAAKLAALNIRVETDHRNEKIGYKIREAQVEKIPYMLVVGDKEAESGGVAVRSRSGGDMGTMEFDAFAQMLKEEIDQRLNKA
ncbi:Threonine--tRNA ligase [bioreactor metagenome]|uniref:Threonine--tRNA ligase n=1 Tax=bioreactor metagenome TaxID=1076179 RepID=A0A645APE8_9ZZZZ